MLGPGHKAPDDVAGYHVVHVPTRFAFLGYRVRDRSEKDKFTPLNKLYLQHPSLDDDSLFCRHRAWGYAPSVANWESHARRCVVRRALMDRPATSGLHGRIHSWCRTRRRSMSGISAST